VQQFSKLTGEVLRRARLERDLTLHDVGRLSRGRFKPSALGAYERGDRGISLERFCGLAEIYGIPPDRLLADLLQARNPEGREELVIDLNRLGLLEDETERLLADLVHRLRVKRRDYRSEVITLRAGDLEALALASGERTRTLKEKLDPVIRPSVEESG